jgi:hypothetical protein
MSELEVIKVKSLKCQKLKGQNKRPVNFQMLAGLMLVIRSLYPVP